jgi:PAS domain S-box-containing protein
MIKYIRLIISIIIIVFVSSLFAEFTQSYIDSLQQNLKLAKKSDKLKILTQMTRYFMDVDPQQCIEYGTEALYITRKNEDNTKSFQILSIMGVAYEYLGSYRKAVSLHEEALGYANKTEEPEDIASCYINLANANQNIRKQDISLEYNLMALKIYRETQFDQGIAKALNNIGNVYLYMDDHKKALGYYLQSIEYKNTIDDDFSLATSLHNLALVYQALDDYNNAMIYFDQALELMHKTRDTYSIGVCYSNIAELQFTLNKFTESTIYAHKALEIFEQLGNKDGIALMQNKLAETQISQNDFNNVVDMILKSLDSAKEMNNNNLIADNYRILSEYYEKTEKTENALLFYKKYKALNDSISGEETRSKIAELNIQYETDQRIKEIELLKKDSENKDKIRNYLIYAVVLGIMVMMFLLNLYFEKLKDAKTRQEISEKLQESEIRFRNLTENLKSAVFTFEVTGLFTYVNPATSVISGYTESELLKMKFYDIIHPIHKDTASQRGFSRLQGEDIESTQELKIITKQGDIKWLQVSSDRIVINNQILVLASATDVTESKINSKEKEKSEAKLRALFAAIKDVILVLDRTGKYLDIAPTNDELLYQPAQDLLGKYISNIFEKDMTEYFLEKIDESLQSNETISVEYSLKIKDHLYWFEGRISPMTENSVVMVVRDITEKTLATGNLIESENKYRNLVESIEEGMVITDKEMNFVFANKAAARLYRYSIEELMNMNVKDVIQPEEYDVIIEQNKIRSEGQSSSYENWNIRKDGTKRLIKVSASPMLKDGKFAGTIALFSDITEIRAAAEKIKSSLKEKEVMLQEIYHRVKNNMQVISSMLKLQSSHINKENALEVFINTQNRVKSMSLIHEKLYRSEDLSNVDFNDYLKSLLKQLFMSYAPLARNIKYHIDCTNVYLNIGTAIPCGLIVNEIVTNSIKHAFPDGIEGNIYLSMNKTDDEKYSLSISNDGIDLPADYSLENSTSFGLQLVEILRHQLKADFILNRDIGAKFTFTFKEQKK